MMSVSSDSERDLIQFLHEPLETLDPLLVLENWEIPEDGFYDESALQMQDTLNNAFMDNVPTATCALPSLSRLEGVYNFGALISPNAGPDCLYSTDLNKIYVNINKNIPVQFRLNRYDTNLCIRALAVYVSSSHQQDVVRRCIGHVAADKEDGKDVDLTAHVLRCASTNAAVYCEDNVSGRFSVCVPVEAPQCGVESFTVCYKFACLNSCQQSNSRRGMGVIFTLENNVGEVLGRQFMNIRVCSCPKRDKEKEEKRIQEEKVPARKRPSKTTEANQLPKKIIKHEPEEAVTVKIPVKACHIKELAKFASDLIYRDVGMQQRQLSEQEKSVLAMYNSIIEAPVEELL